MNDKLWKLKRGHWVYAETPDGRELAIAPAARPSEDGFEPGSESETLKVMDSAHIEGYAADIDWDAGIEDDETMTAAAAQQA